MHMRSLPNTLRLGQRRANSSGSNLRFSLLAAWEPMRLGRPPGAWRLKVNTLRLTLLAEGLEHLLGVGANLRFDIRQAQRL
jgi:hypothetical protein